MMKKILKYELKQLLRDKKTLFFVFILPLVIFPVLNGLLSKAITSRVDEIAGEKTELVSEMNPFLEETLSGFEKDSIFTIVYAENVVNKDSLLKEYSAVITSEYDDSLKLNTIIITHSAKRDKESIQAGSFIGRLKKLRKNISEERYKEIGIQEYYKESLPQIKNTGNEKDMANSQNANLLPITIVMVLLIGTFMISNYIILGEKDNNTLESLLSSGIRREQIIYGKMGMVIMAGIIMSVLELVSFFLYGKYTGAMNFNIALEPGQTAVFILIVISVSVLISSVSVFISCRLRSSTSGQLVFMPVMIAYLVLTLFGTFEGIEIRRGMLLIPIANSAGMIKAIIKDQFLLSEAFIVISANIIYSIFAVKSSSGYLNGEDILNKNSDIDLARSGMTKGAVFTSYALLVVSYMMIGGYLQGRDLVSGLILSQVLILGIFVVLMIKATGITYSKMLKLTRFDPKLILPVIILGLSARYPIALASEKLLDIFPVPKIMNDMNILGTGLGEINFVFTFLIIAVLPALFEEAVFRGVFLTLFDKKYSLLGTAVITGLMFGGMHLNVFTLFETSALGILFGLVTLYSGSIYPAIIMHFLNNAFSVVMMKLISTGNISENHWIFTDGYFMWSMTVTSALSLWLVIYLRKKISVF
jgi:sodium transport system permease protein